MNNANLSKALKGDRAKPIDEALRVRQFVGRSLMQHLEPKCRSITRALGISQRLAAGFPVTEKDVKFLGLLVDSADVGISEDIVAGLEKLLAATKAASPRGGYADLLSGDQ